ncbi:helix-turn-helix domain-containing protein [Actinomadura alba]|uniref:Helix-turn-helix transcriptional regulator n=1 Tax=Actinomadura alba TaxID=406431 RepID=A0ABR7LSF1_9ACTN|nr:helix-turn-helix transcriptional regulator [Actinomadura alba]MBC6467767.1 helix-turn-helix transcriptional regulator [Actinomadura alba]
MTSPFVRRRRLAEELRTLREAKGMTAEALSQLIYHSRTKVSRLENAHIRPDLAEVMKILDILEVTGEKWNEVGQIARDAAERGWWDSYGDTMGSSQRLYADIESGAATIREYNPTTIPGLFQTPEFTWALVELTKAEGTLDYLPERAVDARRNRQSVILSPDGPAYEVVLDEVVIHRLGIPASIMSAQVEHLIETVNAHANVHVRLLRVDARVEGTLLPTAAFFLYGFADVEDPPMAVVNTINTDLVHTKPDEVARYTRRYEHLRQAALSPPDSLVLLRKAAERLIDKAGSRK